MKKLDKTQIPKKHKKEIVYKCKDQILPILNLKNPCPIEIHINDKEVSLFIGQRDWEWDKETGEMLGCGTYLG